MLQFLQRILKVGEKEWPRVAIAWLARFLWQVSFMIGWTIFTVLIVNEFGIHNLPLFYITNALLIMAGVFLLTSLLQRLKAEKSILLLAGIGTSLTILSLLIPFKTPLPFLILSIGTFSIIFSQLSIWLSLFQEELFSPLESIRTFPVIESAETIGGITAGAILLLLVGNMEVKTMLVGMVIILSCLIPLMLWMVREEHKVPRIKRKEEFTETSDETFMARLKEGVQNMKDVRFLKGLVVLIMLSWVFMSVLDFQFTKVVEESVTSSVHETSANTHNESEQALTHGLSQLHILFSSLGLLIQFLIASRVIGRLGIVLSMLLHSVISLFLSGGMFLKFGFVSTVIARANVEGSGVIFKNAYHSSYYALIENTRGVAKEVMEGIFRPLGIIIGTSLILLFQQLLPESAAVTAINLMLVAASLLMLFILIPLRHAYTDVSRKNLSLPSDHPSKFDAVEVLAQNGHRDAHEILMNSLIYKNESKWLKTKIIKALGELKHNDSLPELINLLSAKEPESITIQALNTLQRFSHLDTDTIHQAFSRYRLIRSLHNLYKSTSSVELREHIIATLSHLNDKDVVKFLLKCLKSTDETSASNVLLAMKSFNDASVAHYAEPFLRSQNPWVKAHAIIALWRFKPYRLKTLLPLNQLLESSDTESLLAGVFVLGEVQMTNEAHRLQGLCSHTDPRVRFAAAIALVKTGAKVPLEVLLPILTSTDRSLARQSHGHLSRLHPKKKDHIQNFLNTALAHAINAIAAKNKGQMLEEFPAEDLESLLHYYTLMGEEKEMMRIEKVLLTNQE